MGLGWGLATPDTRLKGALGAGAAPKPRFTPGKPCPVAQHKSLLLSCFLMFWRRESLVLQEAVLSSMDGRLLGEPI